MNNIHFFRTTQIPLIFSLVCLISILTPWFLHAHEEGHGPKVTDPSNFGGVVTAVVEAKDAAKGSSATLVYKGELTRSEDKMIRVYVYGQDMKTVTADQLNPKAKATLSSTVDGKEVVQTFDLDLNNKSYVGKMPEPASRPYNIEVIFKSGDKDLLAAFDHLD